MAVTLARVTYLLALGRDRLSAQDRSTVQVPVYLGDSMHWNREAATLWSEQHFTIVADEQPSLNPERFRFPSELLRDTRRFDELVKGLADMSAAKTRKKKSAPPSIKGLLDRLSIPESMRPDITATFATMCELHDQGRDHIWGYYIRNRARPEWLARPESRVDVLIGNPPWLAYRFMPSAMQREFRMLSDLYHLWRGAKVAQAQDLSGLFVVRAVDKYLKPNGRFALVMPNAALDRGQFEGFQTGKFEHAQNDLRVRFTKPWDLRRLRPHFFPRAAAVVFGSKATAAAALPDVAECWSGRLPRPDAPWSEVSSVLTLSEGAAAQEWGEVSPYHAMFRQGASIVPRVLFMVEKLRAGPLGQVAGRTAVRSTRSANEKAPWKDLPGLKGVVESQFARPVHLGETVIHYRLLAPKTAVIPRDRQGLLDATNDRRERYPNLSDWWQRAEECWESNRRPSTKLTLFEQLDYNGKLEGQFPIPAHRVVYAKSGMHIAAARLDDDKVLIDHKLYWAPANSEAEARYLCAILNSVIVTERVRPLMSYGKDERDIDKHVWKLPIPSFDAEDPRHQELALLGERAEREVAALALDSTVHFSAARRTVREYLQGSETGQRIEVAVAQLLDARQP